MRTEGTELPAAWGHVARHEPKWLARLATVAALVLYITLPDKLIVGPFWLIPGGEAALLLLLSVTTSRHQLEERVVRTLAIVSIGVINAANVMSLVLLVHSLIGGSKVDGRELITSSIQIWLTNVLVFALWFWEIDRGGPIDRCTPEHEEPDFLFPQMVTPEAARPGWTPTFLDYLYVAFTNATAFSPTDTMPLTVLAKMLMAVESVVSLVTVAVVAARAVNILT
ncbi:MAG TPA: hypothetical protein VGS18_01120 [Thermoplasmata archaeon]|nr:hypothetical protein [Thermoplasmata archaeon]